MFFRLQGEYDQAIACLKLVAKETNLDDTELLLLNINLGNTYFETQKMDSAAFYYKIVDSLLPNTHVKMETKVSAYKSLSRFAENQEDNTAALQYWKQYNKWLNEIRDRQEQNYVYGIQQKYDYGILQKELDQKVIRRQRLIIVLSVTVALALLAFAISQIRLARIRKQEAEAKTSLFHFMQQNKALIENNRTQERKVLDTTQQLSDLLSARLMAMQKLDYSLKNPKDKIALKDLEREVFGDGDHWEAVKEVLDALYPGLWETLGLKYPDMDEMERRVYMLSQLKLSRLGEATLLGISTSVLDKTRGKVRKMME